MEKIIEMLKICGCNPLEIMSITNKIDNYVMENVHNLVNDFIKRQGAIIAKTSDEFAKTDDERTDESAK